MIYMVGIKGTGTCALAELLHRGGAKIAGSDGPDTFYTDAILRDLGIPCYESFDARHLDAAERHAGEPIEKVIYSAAYSPATNPELAAAAKRGLPLQIYPDALGAYSLNFDSSGVCGVHGKTTTTALAGMLALGAGLPAQVLDGSAVTSFAENADSAGKTDGKCTLYLGSRYFIAETCEYKRHFLSFHPRRIILTAVESDHQDYYPTYSGIQEAFLEYIGLLPDGGELIYCFDDDGARETAEMAKKRRGDLRLTPYGFTAPGKFQIKSYRAADERVNFTLAGFPVEWRLRIPGRHIALDAAGAIALIASLAEVEWGAFSLSKVRDAAASLEAFRGCKRRSEIVGERDGVLFIDDYGHHPTAIADTLAGFREFYPGRRIILSFMSHTASRTAALLDDFAKSFDGADEVFLHKIYASARADNTAVTGHDLYDRAVELCRPGLKGHIHYYDDFMDAAEPIRQMLKPGDIFVTMGAGDNWKLGRAVL
jgi:UDP-N-acetylmuramate--alanine ligase